MLILPLWLKSVERGRTYLHLPLPAFASWHCQLCGWLAGGIPPLGASPSLFLGCCEPKLCPRPAGYILLWVKYGSNHCTECLWPSLLLVISSVFKCSAPISHENYSFGCLFLDIFILPSKKQCLCFNLCFKSVLTTLLRSLIPLPFLG